MTEVLGPWFASYADAFNRFDAVTLSDCYHCPCLLSDARGSVAFTTPAQVRANFEALLDQHRASDYGHAEPAALEAWSAGPGLAFAEVDWSVTRGDGSPLWRFTNTYHLLERGGGWRICVSVTHANAA